MKRAGVLGAAAAIVIYQLFVPPIVGIADQGDFRRVIGRFGYGPEQRGLNTLYVAPKYVPDQSNRVPEWEQFSSQYFFVWAALAINKIVSKDGKLDIEMMGAVYTIAFLLALARLLQATSTLRRRAWLWAGLVLILTDVAYVAYFNTFFAEPASFIFLLLIAGESIEIAQWGS